MFPVFHEIGDENTFGKTPVLEKYIIYKLTIKAKEDISH